MQTIKDLAWCVLFTLMVCAVVLSLLVLGSWMGDEMTKTDKEKIVTCEPHTKGFYKCQTTWI